MATLTDNKEKMAIVERLVKDGHIDFAEAIKLLEKDGESVRLPALEKKETNPFRPLPYVDVIDPLKRNPLPPPIWCEDSVPFGFLQVKGMSGTTAAITTGASVPYFRDKKGRMIDHNGKKIITSYTS